MHGLTLLPRSAPKMERHYFLILLLSSSVVSSFKETKPAALACLVLRVHSRRRVWRGWPVPGCSNGGSVQAWLTDGHCRERRPACVYSYGDTRAPRYPHHTQTRPQADHVVPNRTCSVNPNFTVPVPALQNVQVGF